LLALCAGDADIGAAVALDFAAILGVVQRGLRFAAPGSRKGESGGPQRRFAPERAPECILELSPVKRIFCFCQRRRGVLQMLAVLALWAGLSAYQRANTCGREQAWRPPSR
jgi:hypothetical protein